MKTTTRFTSFFRCKGLAGEARTLSEIAAALEAAAKELREMEAAGVQLDGGSPEDDHFELATTDPKTAKKYGFDRE